MQSCHNVGVEAEQHSQSHRKPIWHSREDESHRAAVYRTHLLGESSQGCAGPWASFGRHAALFVWAAATLRQALWGRG